MLYEVITDFLVDLPGASTGSGEHSDASEKMGLYGGQVDHSLQESEF